MWKFQILSLITALLYSCGSTTETYVDSPRSVKSIVATTTEVVEKSFAALSTPEMEVNLAFKVSGQILNIPVFTGEEVAVGDVLAQLDPRDFELTTTADRSAYEQAKALYERSVRLLSHEAISKQEAESAETAYTRSKSIYENSLDILNQTTLKAPFKAVVESVMVSEYQRVQSGESVIRVVSPTTNHVSFTIPENLLRVVEDSTTRFSVKFDNYPGEAFNANIVEYARSSSDASGFPVILSIKNPLPSKFHINSGLSATVEMRYISDGYSSVILPLSAIYAPTKGGEYVWIIDKENRAILKKVTLGDPVGQHSVMVENGVENGDIVVVAGVYQLVNGQEVKIIK